jgi:hypothetical protein
MTPAELAAILRTVPETRLRIIELAWELADDEGRLDDLRAAARMGEVRDACAEAEHYGAATKRLAANLSRCLAHP